MAAIESDKKASTSASNLVKWLLVIGMVAAGIIGYQMFAELYDNKPVRVLAILVVGLLASFIAKTTTQGETFWTFAKDARTELRKVVWPTKQETVQTSIIVGVFVIIMALLIWLLDMGLFWATQLLTGQGG